MSVFKSIRSMEFTGDILLHTACTLLAIDTQSSVNASMLLEK